MSRKQRIRIRKNKNKKMYMQVFAVLAILSSLLILQSYRINKINISIAKLESQIEETEMINDSLQGKVLSKRDLNKIEKIAIEKYGMVKPKSKNFTYVSIDTTNKKSLASAKQKNQAKKEAKKGTLFNTLLGRE